MKKRTDVTREEFNDLKDEVKELKFELNNSKELLTKIDGKIDVITEKVLNFKDNEDLKLEPIKERVKKLEDNHTHTNNTIKGSIIGLGFSIVTTIITLVITLATK